MTKYRFLPVLLLALLFLGVPSATLAQGAITAVSPGALDRATLESRCPTFSWAGAAGAESYELQVWEYSASVEQSPSAPTLATTVPGGALSWTPGRESCLEPGTDYLWTIRAIEDGLPSAWSAERVFRTETALDDDRLTEALEIVRRHLDRQDTFGELGEEILPKAPERKAPLSAVPDQRSLSLEQTLEEAREEIPTSRPPERLIPLAPKPFVELGHSVLLEGLVSETNTGVRGSLHDSDVQETVAGYLGVTLGVGPGEFDGIPETLPLSNSEIGVLGVSIGTNFDNHGLVGISRGGSAGRFFQSSAEGEASNQVSLGMPTAALDAVGPVFIAGETSVVGATRLNGPTDIRGTLEWECPADTYRVGTWCIDKIMNGAANLADAVITCHNEGKLLCPVAALAVCDYLNTGKSDSTESCGSKTDDGIGMFRTSTTKFSENVSVFEAHVAYGGNNFQEIIDDDTTKGYWCCKPVSP